MPFTTPTADPSLHEINPIIIRYGYNKGEAIPAQTVNLTEIRATTVNTNSSKSNSSIAAPINYIEPQIIAA